MCDEWGYCSHNGPDKWSQSFPLALGKQQSPIDIKPGNCQSSGSELISKPIQFTYVSKMKTISNTGHGWKVDADDGSTIEGGPLGYKYKLEQFHCHWGRNCFEGSEHTVDGNPYCAEIHLVHYNCDKYASFAEAADKPDGLAVLGIFLNVGDENPELAKIVELLPKIVHNGDSCVLDQDIDVTKFIPENKSYWTYPGSLTTPPCLETVTWILFKNSIQISEEQLDEFRDLLCYGRSDKRPEDEFQGKILANYRPPLELHGREVKSCAL